MGTSKGYIAPTTPHWSQAKRAVTSYINNGDSGSRAYAANKFVGAMKHDISSSESFIRASGNIVAFANAVSRSGLNQALRDAGREDLIGKSSEIVFNELLWDFTNYGSTTEDYLSAESISSALKELQVTDMEQLKDIPCEQLLTEILIEYIKFRFAFRYEEKIRMKKSPAETDKLLKEMNGYISNKLRGNLDIKELKKVDFAQLKTSKIVENALKDAYEVFELFYEETK